MNDKERQMKAQKLAMRKIGDAVRWNRHNHFLSGTDLLIEKIDFRFNDRDFVSENIEYHCVGKIDNKTFRIVLKDKDIA